MKADQTNKIAERNKSHYIDKDKACIQDMGCENFKKNLNSAIFSKTEKLIRIGEWPDWYEKSH